MDALDWIDRLAYPMPELLVLLAVVAILAPIADMLERRKP